MKTNDAFRLIRLLGLVVNAIILWNTLYINAAIEQLATERYEVNPDDVARLSPLVFEHINLLGRYAFALPEPVSRGESGRFAALRTFSKK